MYKNLGLLYTDKGIMIFAPVGPATSEQYEIEEPR